MATKTFEELKQLSIQIRDEKTNKQNTATRVGTAMLEHINKLEQDYYDKTTINNRTSEYNVSINHPTSGISSSNKYDLSSAIAQVPAELRMAGVKVSFLNSAGKPESWKYQGGSWATANFIQESFGGNKILTWKTDAATTRKQVPINERKEGLEISYKNGEGNWVAEKYVGTSFSDDKWGVDYNWSQDGEISGFLNVAYQSIIIGCKPYTTNVIISHRQFVSDETDNNGYKKINLTHPVETGYFKVGFFGNLSSHLLNANLYGVTEDGEAILLYGQIQSQDLLDAVNQFISVRATKRFTSLSLTTNGVIDDVSARIVTVQSEEPITETIKKNYNSLYQQLMVKEKVYTTENLIFTLGTRIDKNGNIKESNSIGISEEVTLNKGDLVTVNFSMYSLDAEGMSLLAKKEDNGQYVPIIICTQNGPEQTITGSVQENGVYVFCKHYFQEFYSVSVINSEKFKQLLSDYVSVGGLKKIKRWDILGDSFSQYPNNGTYVKQENCWYRLIAARNNMPFNDAEQVHAQGGRTLAYHETADGNTIVEHLDEIPEDTELITIMAGANDCYVYNINIGEFTPSSIPSTPQECTTFYSGLVYTFNKLLTKFPKANIIYIIEPRNKTSNPFRFDDYIKAIKTACAYYSVPYINIAEECCQLQPYIESKQKIYYVWALDGTTLDGTHPGTEGHRLMSYFIESKISPYLNHI